MNRRRFILATAVMTAAATFADSAFAEWNPRRPLNIIVPYAAGGGTDLFARAVASAAKDRLPVPVVIVNKPGASGITGAIEAANARPDGNTIMMHSTGSFLLRHMFKDTEVGPFDSFQTIAQIGDLTGVLVVPASSPYQSVQDVVDAAKAEPGKLRWSHNGRGATFHVTGQTMLDTLGLEAVDVPFNSGSASRAAIMGEQVDFGVIGIQQTTGFEEQIRVLGVVAEERDELRSDVPTFQEQGFDVPLVSSPIVLFAPNGVDPEIVSGMEALFKEIAESPEFGEVVRAKGSTPLYRNGADAEAALREMQKTTQPVIDDLKANEG